MSKIVFFIVLCILTSCQSVKKNLGLERTPPNEFSVVGRSELTIPPDFNLNPPKPGEPDLHEKKNKEKVKNVLFKKLEENSNKSNTEIKFLEKAGTQNLNPDIRQIITKETRDEAQSTKNKLFSYFSNKNKDTIDPFAEKKKY